MVIFLVPLTVFILFYAYKVIFRKNWSRGLSCELRFTREYVDEGERCELSEILTNAKRLPLLFLQVKFSVRRGIYAADYPNASVSDQTYFSEVFSLRSYERITRKLELQCEKRGYYTINSADLIGINVLAGEKNYETCIQGTALYVFPRMLPFDAFRLPFEQLMGEEQKRSFMYEDPFTFRGIRDYMTFDSLKNVNWKMTAKTGELKINQRDSTTSRQVTILLNLEAPLALFDSELLEDGIRLALTMAREFSTARVRSAVYTNGRDMLSGETFFIDGGETGEHLRSLAEGLSRIDLSLDKRPFEEMAMEVAALDSERRSTYCIISTNVRDEVIRGAEHLKNGRSNIVWLCPQKRRMDYSLRESGIDFYRIVTD